RECIPGYDPWRCAGESWFDLEAAQRAVDFFQHPTDGCLRHIEGDMAGELFNLEPWQQAIVGNIFGWQKRDRKGRIVRRYREVMIYVPRKNGKALAADTPIPTPSGWVAMGDLSKGDTVFDERGKPCRVTAVTEVMHGR